MKISLAAPIGLLSLLAMACSGDDGGTNDASGGAAPAATGGTPSLGGSPASGGSTGGSPVTGGQAATTGGATSGGAATGGTAAGGAPEGGSAQGGEAPATGGTSTGGASGGSTSVTECPAAPDGVPAEAVTALDTENAIRVAMGIPCAGVVTEVIQAAQNHCDYYVQNQGTDCAAPSAHNEIDGCPGFTGTDPGQRLRATGYMGRGWSEDMAFTGNPTSAVMTFVNSVYHRTPILDPWMRDMGYGGGDGCDTIDFGGGPTTPDDVTAFYPYDGATDIPTSFDGSREGPEPPQPSTGWPSGYPITLYARSITVTEHHIMVDGTSDDLPHLFLSDDDPTLPSYAKVFYTEAPLTAMTTYRVVIDTDQAHFEWTFTTGASSGGGRPGRP